MAKHLFKLGSVVVTIATACRRTLGGGPFCAFLLMVVSGAAAPLSAASLNWTLSSPQNYEYGQQLVLPAAFGAGEFTMELWLRPDASFPIGSATGGQGQLRNWSSADRQPYGSDEWWYEGNFLLDGHNNGDFSAGTFSLQFYGGGRIRWLFGDDASDAVRGAIWSVGAYPASNAPSLLDGNWHHVALVRRFVGTSSSQLELWVDGALIDTESTPVRANMRQWWNGWGNFPAGQRGWFWGAEKQAAIGVLPQYEDYKGLLDEVRFWTRAKTQSELTTQFTNAVSGNEPNLAGWYAFNEGTGNSTCNSRAAAECISLLNTNANIWSSQDAPLSGGAPDNAAPSVPGNAAATAVSASQINVSWNASTDNVAVTGYRVRRDGVDVATVNVLTYSDSGLASNTAFAYTVSAVDAAGNRSAESAIAAATTFANDSVAPTVPANVQAIANSSTQVSVSWQASTDDIGVVSYRVRRDNANIGTATTTSFVDTGRTPNTTYSYTISAVDAAGNRSAESTSATATTPAAPDTQAPTTPANLTGTAASATRVDLSWSASSDNVGVTNYQISRGGVAIATTTATNYSDVGLMPSTTYTYTVSAADAVGNVSANSAPRSVTTPATPPSPDNSPPTVPTGLALISAGSSRVELSWNIATDNVAVASYRVLRNGVQVGMPTITSFIDTGVAPNTDYTYTVSAADAAGNRSAESAPIALRTPAAADTQAPTAPGALAATAAGPTRVSLAWTAATDNVGVAGYRVRRDGTQIGSTAGTTFTDSNVLAATRYSYVVMAVDAAGNISADSNASVVTTPSAPPSGDTSPPTTPANVRATASGTDIDLAWAESSDNVAVAGYHVFRDGSSLLTTTELSIRDTALEPNRAYSYTVAAVDAAGNRSTPSAAASATTGATPPSPVQLPGGGGLIDWLTLTLLAAMAGLAVARRQFDARATVSAWL